MKLFSIGILTNTCLPLTDRARGFSSSDRMYVSRTLLAVAALVAMATVAVSLPPTNCQSVMMNNQCPMNTSLDMPAGDIINHLYPGYFLPEESVDNLFQEAFKIKSYRRLKNLPIVPCKDGKCYRSGRLKRDVSDCCDMETNILQLISVEKDGMEYSVVSLPSGSQYFTENSCSTEDVACNTGTCKSLIGLHWVLVLDPNVAYYPPIRFVMVEFKMGCSCQR